MATLNPAPSDLGLASPALGPWFSNDITIPAPNADLSASVALSGGVHWLPPAGGLLSLFVASTPRPRGLAGLRQASGAPAFTDGRLVALFRLLPEVEERLHSLVSSIPSADGGSNPGGVPTRARVRYLALELPEDPPTLSMLESRLHPPFPGGLSDAEKAEHVGLRLDGTNLTNADKPMFDLKRTGVFQGGQERLLGALDITARLWAFDAGGRAIDPGAVAAWWRFLADDSVFDNLWAEGLDTADQRTASTDAQLTLHLANAHEGPIGDTLLGRLNFTNVDGTGLVRTRGSDSGAAQIAFTDPPDPDDAPVPKMAMLPNGTYADTLALWPSGPVNALLARDSVRVAVVGVEEHLVGQKRTTEAASGTPAARRAEDQNRVSTRVSVARTSGPALLATTDEAADAAIAVFTGSDPTRLVTSVLERDWAGLDPASLPEVAPPDNLPELSVSALTGGGAAVGGTVTDQRILLEMTFDASLAGAWVRAWPQGFDPTRGRHFRMDGGAGRVRSDGGASLVVRLPDGDVSPDAPMGVDVIVVTQLSAQLYMDNRFTRPAPVGGSPLDIGSAAGEIVVCETGQAFAGGSLPDNSVPSGVTLFARETAGPSLIDRASLPASAFTSDTLVRNLAAGDVVELTQPAFGNVPEGDAVSVFASTGATLNGRTRQGLDRILQAGAPLPTMERLEIACTRVGASGAQAAVAATPALGRYHELLPHQSGHPGAPAAVEIHGAGAVLSGPAAIGVAEFTRDRTAGSTVNLVNAAASPFAVPAEPTPPSLWAAVLRTVAAQVEAEPGLAEVVVGAGDPYPFGDTLDNIRNWLSRQGITIPAGLDAAATSIVRALDRRMMITARGAREGATSLLAAFQRAEDFVYIETPALDDSTLGGSGDELALWQALKNRMDERPALRVLICAPIRHIPGTPAPMGRVRDALLIEAVEALRAQDAERVAVFSPSAGPGRTLRLASTTVIVDDAYALTGTTHLWRRGLGFDSSLAVAVFDEQLDGGRPAEVRQFRRELIASRLGLPVSLVPDDPAELVDAVRALGERGGGGRLTTDAIIAPDPTPTDTDRDIWNRDGSPQPGFDPIAWITSLTSAVRAQLEEAVTPAP
jgi:hypothetical protein